MTRAEWLAFGMYAALMTLMLAVVLLEKGADPWVQAATALVISLALFATLAVILRAIRRSRE